MRALLHSGGRLRLAAVARPERAGECLVRVRTAGICGTDLEILEGYTAFDGVLGHEFVGDVEAVAGPDDRGLLGARVVGEINIGCGSCPWCRRGEKEHCLTRRVLGIRDRDGAFADYLTLPAANLHVVPDAMPDEVAAFTEPVAAACRILDQVPLAPGERVAVLGDGRMGLIIAQVLRSTGAHVTLLGRHANRIALAASLGIDTRESPAAALPPDDRFDTVVEATGAGDGLAHALDCVRPRGRIVFKSTVHGAPPLATWPVVVDEVTIIGSRCGPFRPALNLLASGTVEVRPLVTAVVRLEDYAEAFRAAAGGLKVLFAIAGHPSP